MATMEIYLNLSQEDVILEFHQKMVGSWHLVATAVVLLLYMVLFRRRQLLKQRLSALNA